VLAHGSGERTENCLPGMVERTVYVGATLQIMVRLATGGSLQATVANTGDQVEQAQGTPVQVHIPPDALRVLGGDKAAGAPRDAEAEAEPVSASA